MTDPEHAGWFDDATNIIIIASTTPGLPLPSISGSQASFNFTGIKHAQDAREAVAMAETILSYAFRVEFHRDDPPQIGSSQHYMLSAYLPSGLPLFIVALGEHFAVDIPLPAVAAPPQRVSPEDRLAALRKAVAA